MAIQLTINSTAIPLTDDGYKFRFSTVDKTDTTEAGTTVRQFARGGIVGLDVELTCENTLLSSLIGFSKLASVTVQYWNEVTNSLKTDWTAYLHDLTASLITEESTERLYKVAFALDDLSTA